MRYKQLNWLVVLLIICGSGTSLAGAQIRSIERVSVDDSGVAGDGSSSGAAINSDGSIVAFVSSATNLVSGDTNNTQDVFVRNRTIGTTTRVSVGPGGVEGNAASGVPVFAIRPVCVSSDGTFIGFPSGATNLDRVDQNSNPDFFVFDRTSGVNETSVRSIIGSSTGGNGASDGCAISDDGSTVAFSSYATNFASGDTNGASDIFTKREQDTNPTLVSQTLILVPGNAASFDPSMSADGGLVAFTSSASDLVSNDTNGVNDVFLYSSATGTVQRISVSSSAVEGNAASAEPFISESGDYVVFYSSASNLVSADDNLLPDIFLYTIATGAIERIGTGYFPSISSDGRFVAFLSSESNLVSGDTNGSTDVFVYDRIAQVTQRINLSENGAQSSGQASDCMISSNGRFVVFSSNDTSLVSGGSSNPKDVYIAEIQPYLTRQTRLTTPPEVTVSGRKVTVIMESFSGVALGSSQSQRSAFRPRVVARAGRVNFRYQATLRGTGSSAGDIMRKVSRRNQITFRNVSPGRYNASYRVVIRQGRRTVDRTNVSPRASVTVR